MVGALAGLVGITPSSGYVHSWAAIIIGIVTSICCISSLKIKEWIGADDALDAFSLHGVGGFVGNILTGIFAQKWVALLDGSSINGGAIDGNPIQIAYQLAGSFSIAAYSFIGSIAILLVIDRIPGLKLRSSAQNEDIGTDKSEMGELAYQFTSRSSIRDEVEKVYPDEVTQ